MSWSRLDQALRGKPVNRGLRLAKTLDFLAEILLEVNHSDLATGGPQPGLGRRSPAEAFPSVYFEFMIAAYGRSGAVEKAENLHSRYQDLLKASSSSAAGKAPSIHLLTALMISLVQQKRFAEVGKYWSTALSSAIEKGRHYTLDLSDPFLEPETTTSSTARPEADGISLQSSEQVFETNPPNPFLHRDDIRILAAHRYTLAGPLTQYIFSLGAQNLAANLPPLVLRLEQMGFSLTSKNWNHYIQVLSYSNDLELQLLAFKTFEEKLLPNMPPWQLMKRSKWSKRSLVDGSGEISVEEPIERKSVERFRPQILVPTYWTMVYMGIVLIKFQQRSLKGEEQGLSLLRSQAPRSVSAVSTMPYLREKAQGVLLRGRTLRGDPQKRPRRPSEANRAGLRGSRAAIDHISLSSQIELEKLFKSDQVLGHKESDVKPTSLLHAAGEVLGETQRSPLVLEAAGRYESEAEFRSRLQVEERNRARLLEQLRKDYAHPHVMADEKRGEPFFEVELHGQYKTSTTLDTTTPYTKEKAKLLKTVLNHPADRNKGSSHPLASGRPLDVSPAALLSAARRPKAAARLHRIRQRKRARPEVTISTADFRRGIKDAMPLALIARQPRLRTPNRLSKAFTKNKADRRIRKESERAGRSTGQTESRSRKDSRTSDFGTI